MEDNRLLKFSVLFAVFFECTVCMWASCFTLLSLVALEQQSAHAKEATENMEVAILKTCQSISDLRREVSNSLSCFHPSAL